MKLKIILIANILYLLISLQGYGQDCYYLVQEAKHRKLAPNELADCLKQSFEKKLFEKDNIITQNFKTANVVLEGEIINMHKHELFMEYEVIPYTVFKGIIDKNSTVKIMVSYPPNVKLSTKENREKQTAESYYGRGSGLFFFQKIIDEPNNMYHLINSNDSCIGYLLDDIFYYYDFYQKTLYPKIAKLENAKFKRTPFYFKKKESLAVIERKGLNEIMTITGFSRDTVPAGIRSGDISKVTI